MMMGGLDTLVRTRCVVRFAIAVVAVLVLVVSSQEVLSERHRLLDPFAVSAQAPFTDRELDGGCTRYIETFS